MWTCTEMFYVLLETLTQLAQEALSKSLRPPIGQRCEDGSSDRAASMGQLKRALKSHWTGIEFLGGARY